MVARKSTASKTAAPAVTDESPLDSLTRGEDEDAMAHLLRLKGIGGKDAAAAMVEVTLVEDDKLRRSTFDGRVYVSWFAGHTLAAYATAELGVAPDGFNAACATVGVTDKNRASWLDRAYSTLHECWTIATYHNHERMESFVAAWVEVHAKNPTQLRDYAAWLRADARGGKTAAKNVPETIRARKVAAEKAAQSAKDAAAARSTLATNVKTSHDNATPDGFPIDGLPMSRAQIDALSVEVLDAAAALFVKLAAAKRKDAKTADDAADANETAADVGPVPTPAKRKPRTAAAA